MTLQAVAREAGVSLATADRAVNGRTGVHDRTVSRVAAAVAKLNYRPDPMAVRLARNRAIRLAVVLPDSSTDFAQALADQVKVTADWLSSQRAFIDAIRADVFDPVTLGELLEGLAGRYDGVATIALDHPRVHAALDQLSSRGTAVVTMISDAPSARRLRYVGIDNAAAGRTAGSLLGRFTGGRSGPVGLIAGSQRLRDHAERLFGFTQVLGGEYPGLHILSVREGRDDAAQNEALVAEMLSERPDLMGLYNTGAGNRGIAAALERAGRAQNVIFIGHELTPSTRRLLATGVMDACINQDAGHEVRSAARVLLAHCLQEPIVPEQERIRIDVYLRDNLP